MSYQYSEDPEENLPDWLKELRERQAGAEGDPPEESSSQPPEESAPEAEDEQTQPVEEDDEEPDWLLELRKRHESDGEAGQPSSAPAFKEESEPKEQTPAFDEEAVEDDIAALEPANDAEEQEEKAAKPSGTGTLPDWLEQEQPEAGESEPEADPEADLAPAELPSWLEALRPSELSSESQEQASGPDRGKTATEPLEGLEGVLPGKPDASQVGRAPGSASQIEVSKSQSRHVAAFRRLLSNEGRASEDFEQRIAGPTRMLRFFFGAVLVLAALIPFLTGSQAAIRPALDSLPESAAVYNEVELMPDSAHVLVVFEVQPALFGEVEAAATNLLDHLLDRQARLVFISTQPTGPGLVDKLLNQRFSSHPLIASGEYANLGYLSGGTSAVRNFASAPRQTMALGGGSQNTLLESIGSLDDFGLILVVSGDAEDARAWIEQAGSYTSNGMLMATSAQAEPLLLPYLENEPNTLRGLIGGIEGAAYYERLRSQDGLASAYWESYSYGLGAMALLILIGGLYGRLIHLRPDEDDSRDEESNDAV